MQQQKQKIHKIASGFRVTKLCRPLSSAYVANLYNQQFSYIYRALPIEINWNLRETVVRNDGIMNIYSICLWN